MGSRLCGMGRAGAALFLAGLAGVGQAGTWARFNASVHNRYLTGGAQNPSFLLAGHDLTGIAVNRPGALITPQHFITATHVISASRPGTVQFRGSDGALHTFTITHVDRVSASHWSPTVNGTDVSVATLDRPITPEMGITHYPVLREEDFSYAGSEVFVFATRGEAAGRNKIEAVSSVATSWNPANDTWIVAFDWDTATNGGTNGVGDDEFGLTGGDSGWPVFINVSGRLALVGANFAKTGGAPYNYFSFTSFLPRYLSQLESIVSAEGHTMTTTMAAASAPVPCYADVNGDGLVNMFDMLGFMNLFAARNIQADMNGDGRISIFDLLRFFESYDTGCDGSSAS